MGEERLYFRREEKRAQRVAKQKSSTRRGIDATLSTEEMQLFESLLKPLSVDEMQRVSGVGAAKLERYGEAFLERIKNAVDSSTVGPAPKGISKDVVAVCGIS